MKIAVISDIHGNMSALEAVCEDIKSQGCEKVFVLGDYAMAGPFPFETVNFFMKKQGDLSWKMIQGNTDLMIADYSDELYEDLKSKAPIMAQALKDDSVLLNTIQKDFLKSLPEQLTVKEENITFLLVHGSPRKNNEDILPETPLEKLEEMIKGAEADVILCGHTHLPCGFLTSDKKTVVNVGSVGRPFTENPKSCYLKITVENGETLFEHRFVNYDKEQASKDLSKRRFSGADKLAKMLINPTIRHF